MLRKLRQTLAGLLVMLTVLPFTAPFATCKAAMLFGDELPAAPQQSSQAPLAPPSSSLDDGSLAHALPLLGSAGRVRVRFLSRLETSASAGRAVTSVGRAVSVSLSEPRASACSSLTVLRI